MTSTFASLVGAARSAIDAVFGEAASLLPMDRARGPHGARAASASRPVAAIMVAFFHDTDRAAKMRAQPVLGQSGDRLLNRSPEILGSVSANVQANVGDHVHRTADGVTYEIIAKDPDGVGNIILALCVVREGAG